MFDCYLVKASFLLVTTLHLKNAPFNQEKKEQECCQGESLQDPAGPTPMTVEATRIPQYMGMKSSRSNWVCLQNHMMRHKEKRARVWFSLLHYVSRTAYPHHGFNAMTFSPSALSWCTLDRLRGLAVGKTCVPVASGVLDDCKSL